MLISTIIDNITKMTKPPNYFFYSHIIECKNKLYEFFNYIEQ